MLLLLLFVPFYLLINSRLFHFYFKISMVISFLTYRFLSILIGILYPSYQTYKSLKYQYTEQYSSLLCYWILFSFFQIFEVLFDQLFSLIIPFYFELKLIFIFWLTYKNISELIFHHVILIYLNQYEHDIDYLFNNTIHRLTEYVLKIIYFFLQHHHHHQQQDTQMKTIKTNFASQYRRINSHQRK